MTDMDEMHRIAVTREVPAVVVPTPPVLDDKEKVAKVRSPTGEPKVKPSAVKWWLGAAIGAAAGLEYCAEHAPAEGWRFACRVAQLSVVGFLGSASPGFRKR